MVLGFSAEENKKVAEQIRQLNETFLKNDKEIPEILNLIASAKAHAETLNSNSIALDDLLSDTRNTDAVRAVTAYKDIVNAINNARNSASEAIEAANKASNQVSFLKNV